MGSKFKNYQSFLVDTNTPLAQFQTELKTHLLNAGWQQHGADGANFFDVIPGAGQAIGNELGKEIVRFQFGNGTVTVRSYLIGTTPVAARFMIYGSGTGTYTPQTRINGLVITAATGNYTANTAMPALLTAIQARVDAAAPELAGLSFRLVVVPGGADYIEINCAIGAPCVIQNYSYAYGAQLQAAYTPGVIEDRTLTAGMTVTTDFGSGFIYYLSIHERSIGLATKTTVGFYGPVWATYADHGAALAQTPSGCIPIELILLNASAQDVGAVLYMGATWVATHAWGYTINQGFNSGYTYVFSRAPSGPVVDLRDVVGDSPATQGADAQVCVGGIYGTSAVGYLRNLLGTSMPTYFKYALYGRTGAGSGSLVSAGPSYTLDDPTHFGVTATNESLQLARDYTGASTVTAAVAADATELPVADTAAFPDAGTALIGLETVEYTGKTASSLTGVTRGKMGTVGAAYASGRAIYPALWYVKINNGVLLAGTVKPV